MGYIESAALIDAHIEIVWQALNDIHHTPDWVTGLEKAEVVTSGVYGAGTIYKDYNRLGPMLQVTPWHITVFEPTTRQIHVSESASLPSTMTLTLTPLPEGTRLVMQVEYRFLPRLGFFSRWLEKLLMNRVLKQVIQQNQASLNRYLNP
ncbi:MAG: SRPBCC family protein [Anaerolineae bacterium]|nr:SRPBCC family protein [Anaerolineae bacterium]